jgi:lipopolysaccharide/colanic/teichoic acid biosynthesis glycosyltransferase
VKTFDCAKRGLDICVSATLLVFCLPLATLVAVAIWMVDGRPVFFTQERPGLGEQLFRVHKFRTMKPAESEAHQVVSDAERLTALGRFVRQWSLDELPQLWDVLRGELSLVGPRPLLPRYLPHLTERERLRHSVRPGITGWAQLQGRNLLRWDERLEHDVWYVEHRSFGLDLKILMLTVPYVLRSRGVVPDARAVLPNLDEERRSRA